MLSIFASRLQRRFNLHSESAVDFGKQLHYKVLSFLPFAQSLIRRVKLPRRSSFITNLSLSNLTDQIASQPAKALPANFVWIRKYRVKKKEVEISRKCFKHSTDTANLSTTQNFSVISNLRIQVEYNCFFEFKVQFVRKSTLILRMCLATDAGQNDGKNMLFDYNRDSCIKPNEVKLDCKIKGLMAILIGRILYRVF